MHSVTNIFGTDGIRAQTGQPPLSLELLPILGKAIATWAIEKYGEHCTLLLAHDTRASCAFVKTALKSGLLLYPVKLYDALVLPTPAVFQLIKQHQTFNGGIIISASHNPHQDNGIKLIDETTGKITAQDEQKISRLFHSLTTTTHHTYHAYGTETYWPHAAQQYQDFISQQFSPSFLSGKKIVLDCAHGATSYIAPDIFSSLGAHVFTMNNQPNGTNINDASGSLHPQHLQKAVIEHQADAGFAFDGDGDRVIAVNNKGDVKNGDDMLALLLDHPLYTDMPSVVGTILTNQGLEAFLHKRCKTLIRVPVGDKYIAEKLKTEKLILGGEQSGHIITHDYLPTGDGIFAALRLLETITLTHNWGMETFTKYPQFSVNVPVRIKKDLQQPPLAHIIQESQAQLHTGRLIVRYSGTESLLRITAEDSSLDTAQMIVHALSQKLQKELAKGLNDE